MKLVEGYVERISYRYDDIGYSVIYLSNPEPKDDEDDEVCCVGYFSFVSEDLSDTSSIVVSVSSV